MKAIGIVTGPRKGQVTDRLTESALDGLRDRGASTEKIYFMDLTIKPCRGCSACQRTGRCIIEDDFNAVADKIRDADIVVFSSPTYFSNVTSCAKRFFDRGYSMFKEFRFGPVYPSKKPGKVILITSCHAPFPFSHLLGIVTGSVRAMKAFFNYMHVRIKTLTATGAADFDAKKHAKLLERAYNLGKTI
ncbi:MAG: flavodoxin family protein [Candidatus Omnitrophica bacterium]|nr:flavodoxin family protein [Candidatus Omnitrophota bacterium]